MVDRSKCKRCSVPLTSENAYKRKDTYNHLHCYCKSCYLVIQKERTKTLSDNGKKYTTLVRNGSYRPLRVFFNSLDEKRLFLSSRKSLSKCYRSNDTISGIPIGSSAVNGDPESCEECGGTMRYDERGFLCCEKCGLLSDITPFYREVGVSMLKGRHSWNGEDADEMCCDSYFSTAYSKY